MDIESNGATPVERYAPMIRSALNLAPTSTEFWELLFTIETNRIVDGGGEEENSAERVKEIKRVRKYRPDFCTVIPKKSFKAIL